MAYVTTEAVNLYLGTCGEDPLIASFIASAESIFNHLINSSGLSTATYTEKYRYPLGGFHSENIWRVFYLDNINPTALTSVDGTAVSSWDYYLEGRKLTLKNSVSYQQTFPHLNTIIYTAGYATIPDDVKQAIKMMVWFMYNSKNANWLSSFTQDQLEVTYGWENRNSNGIEQILSSNSIISSIIGKYKKTFLGSSGFDRVSIEVI